MLVSHLSQNSPFHLRNVILLTLLPLAFRRVILTQIVSMKEQNDRDGQQVEWDGRPACNHVYLILSLIPVVEANRVVIHHTQQIAYRKKNKNDAKRVYLLLEVVLIRLALP